MDDNRSQAAHPSFWGWMEQRRRELGLRPTVLHHDRTRRRIRRGELVRDDVYERLDTLLSWMPGDALRAATQGIPPRCRDGSSAESVAPRRVAAGLIRVLSDAITAAADAGDRLSPTVAADAERQVRALVDRIRAEQAAHNFGRHL